MPSDHKLPRREFLKISSAVVAGTAAASILQTRPLFGATLPANAVPLLSVGYAAGAPAENASVRLGYASEILSGDPAFLSRAARVTISSWTRRPKATAGAGSGFEVDAIFPANGYTPEKYPRFRAWLAVDRNGFESAAAGAHFRMPVTSTVGTQFVIRRLRAATKSGETSEPEESLLRLSTGIESGTLKLQKGVYAIAFREDGSDEAPNWAGYKLLNSHGALSIPNANFSYVLMTVDFAE